MQKLGLTMFKRNDFRCLKPSETKDPKKWSYYDMKGYREAKTKEELENVREIMYDKYFFNFEDPQIFKEMMDKNKGPKLWKKTYGFEFVSLNRKMNQPVENFECKRYCYKAEFGNFARQCKKDKGIFKCIYLRYLYLIWKQSTHELFTVLELISLKIIGYNLSNGS